MLNRWLGILSLGAMALANAALFKRDILPIWVAEEPPRHGATFLGPGDSIKIQVGIYDANKVRIGTAWTYTRVVPPPEPADTDASVDGGQTQVRGQCRVRVFSRTNLRAMRLPGNLALPEVVIRTSLLFDERGLLDDLDIGLDGLDATIKLKGERFSATDFACQWQVGDQRGSFILPDSATRALGDVLRPFDTLPELYVGRVWRMELINPLAHVMPNSDRRGFDTESVLVRVTAEEKIQHRGREELTYRVEARGVRAWVLPEGRVLRQEVDLPFLGTLTILDEAYTERAWYSGGVELGSD